MQKKSSHVSTLSFLLAGAWWLLAGAAAAQDAGKVTLNLVYTSSSIGYVDPCG
ncbi:hypothetical protein KJ068_02155 [bacterium]|nr:hypothetical protein [bacterium]